MYINIYFYKGTSRRSSPAILDVNIPVAHRADVQPSRSEPEASTSRSASREAATRLNLDQAPIIKQSFFQKLRKPKAAPKNQTEAGATELSNLSYFGLGDRNDQNITTATAGAEAPAEETFKEIKL